MTGDGSDGDEWAEGGGGVPTQEQRLQQIFSRAGSGVEHEQGEGGAAAGTKSSDPSRSQSPREPIVLKLRAGADGRMESRLETRRTPRSPQPHVTSTRVGAGADGRMESRLETRRTPHSPQPHATSTRVGAGADGRMESRLETRRTPRSPQPHATSTRVVMEFIARLQQTMEKLPREQPDAGASAAAPAARRRERAHCRGHAADTTTTATVSREEYFRLKEKYTGLEKTHKDLQEKYYWLEKQALILVKMLRDRGAVAASEDTHGDVDPMEEEASRAPATVVRRRGVTRVTPAPGGTRVKPAPSGTPVTPAPGGTRVKPAPSGTPVTPAPGGTRVKPAPGGTRVTPAPGGTRVTLAPGVTLSRAQWREVQAATHSRALVRKLALFLFGRRVLLQYQDLDPERMRILQAVLRERLAGGGGGLTEEAERQLTPAAARSYVQSHRAQLRMQAKRQRDRARAVQLTCRECNKRFRSPSLLAVHARAHSGERPYSCSECGARFMYHTQFNTHARAHGSVRAHVCPRCGAAFPQLAHLHWHARRQHAAAPPAHARAIKPVKPHPDWMQVPLRHGRLAD